MTPAGGRRPATRSVFAIEEPELLLPDPIALDTSFVVEAMIAIGADAIVTIDTGFALLPSALLTVYTDRSRLASCRSKRPR